MEHTPLLLQVHRGLMDFYSQQIPTQRHHFLLLLTQHLGLRGAFPSVLIIILSVST